MTLFQRALACLVACGALGGATAANDAPMPERTELKRTALTATGPMEVISSTLEFPPGTELRRHFHHGIESGYVLQGALIQRPGSAPERFETGTPILNLRDVHHGGFKIVGNTALKIFTVHVVDRDKPLYEYTD